MLMLSGCGGSSSGSGSTSNPTYSASVSPGTLTITAVANPLDAYVAFVTLNNTGSAPLTVTAASLSGTNANLFTVQSQCLTMLATGTSCSNTVTFSTTGSGTFSATLTFTDNAGTQTVALTGIGIASPTAADTIDCSVNSDTCPDTFTGAYTTANSQLATDTIAAGLFHGYADPSNRKDPNSTASYLAYSWAKTLSDGTHVVDLHLAQSTNNGSTFTYVGPLYQSVQTTQTGSTAYSPTNDSSTETIDLLPIPLTGSSAGQTLWVQAHQSYLVAPKGGIYDQLNATNLISVTAVQLTPAQEASPSQAAIALLALGAATTPEARLGAADTDPTRNITQNLTTFNSTVGKCANWGQPTLWYQSPYLYLALECTENAGSLDGNELAHFLYVTTPTGSNASTWVWSLAAEFATPAQAAKLGATTAENATYSFFTEPEFVATKSGQLAVLLTPGVFNTSPTATQPVIQYGCRLVPVTALSPTGITLDTDTTTGALVNLVKITENDLYTSPNEGPAACTYEPTSVNGIIMGRKFEDDATYGFYLYPLNSTIAP
jgi:hypothetical protein